MVPLGIALGPLLLSVAAQGTRGHGQPPYLQVRFPTPAYGLATGDLDGDGDVDLVACGGTSVLLLWNSGAGWIERTESLAVPAHAAAVGDLDGDGEADLVTVKGDQAYVLLGDGQGGFSTPTQVRLGAPATDVLLADLDGDTDLDIIAVCAGSVRILLGDGQGGFGAGSSTSLAQQGHAGALGDLDEDGWLDLVVEPDEQLLFGDGQGGLVPGGSLGISWGGDFEPSLDDFDGDGHLDILGLDGQRNVKVFWGDGQGGFPSSTTLPAPAWDFAVGDLDGDGDADLVCKDYGDGPLTVWLNDGGGTVSQGGSLIYVGSSFSSHGIVLPDLDGDGALDVAVGGYSGVALFPGDGAGWLVLPDQLPGVASTQVELADLDRDGDQDVVCAANGVTTFPGEGQGGFGTPLVTPLGEIGRIAVGDLDEDGILDLATSGSDAALIALGDGTGRFGQVKRYLKGLGPDNACLADVDGDDHLDVVYACHGGGPPIWLLLGDGGGGFVEQPISAPAADYKDLALRDVSGDGRVDIAALSYESFNVFPGDGHGGFGTPTSTPMPDDTSRFAIADLDQDGRLDLLVGGAWQTGPWLWVLWGEAGGGLSTPAMISSATVFPRDFEIADVEGDGVPELLVGYGGCAGESYPGGIAILHHSAAREFTWTWTVGQAGGVASLAAGDLDRNGLLDLVSGGIRIIVDPFYWESPGPVEVLLNQLPPLTPCTSEVSYCLAKLNAAGCLPRICSRGTPSLSGPDDFVVSAERVSSHRFGLMIWGLASAGTPFQGGRLCIASPITRTTLQGSGGTPGLFDCSGAFAYAFTQAYMTSKGLTAGTQVYAQYWYRDVAQPPPVFPTGLTDALNFTIQT